jgi:hypothetical protein
VGPDLQDLYGIDSAAAPSATAVPSTTTS